MNNLEALGLEKVEDQGRVFEKKEKGRKICVTVDSNWFNVLYEKWKLFNRKKSEQDFCNQLVCDALDRMQKEYEMTAGDV